MFKHATKQSTPVLRLKNSELNDIESGILRLTEVLGWTTPDGSPLTTSNVVVEGNEVRPSWE